MLGLERGWWGWPEVVGGWLPEIKGRCWWEGAGRCPGCTGLQTWGVGGFQLRKTRGSGLQGRAAFEAEESRLDKP